MKFTQKKSLGQNFLIDQNILNNIADVGKVGHEDLVIEVGPGSGALTNKILERKPKNLIVIEKDRQLSNFLLKKFKEKIKIINEDMMKFSYENFKGKNHIIFGNLPYNISTQILAKWIKIKNINIFCKKFVLMFQKEVADRIIAKTNTKNYGRLSILSNWRMKIDKIFDIEPESFNPVPKVRSTLLVLVPKNNFYNLKDPKNLEYITNIFFSQRRKMIKKPLKILFKNYEEISKKLNLDLDLRPQNLDSVTYYKICELYEASIQ